MRSLKILAAFRPARCLQDPRSLLLLPLCILQGSCERVELPSFFGPKIPVERILIDGSGRELAVEIIGRDQDSITFVRKRDSGRFSYPIERLSPKDAAFARKLPLVQPPRAKDAKTSSRGAVSIDPEIDLVERRLAEVGEELSDLFAERLKVEPGTIRSRSINSTITKLTRRQEDLRTRMQELRSNR